MEKGVKKSCQSSPLEPKNVLKKSIHFRQKCKNFAEKILPVYKPLEPKNVLRKSIFKGQNFRIFAKKSYQSKPLGPNPGL